MYVTHLEVENLRSFAKVSVGLNVPRMSQGKYPNINVVLGSNGAGKTTLLRAVALAVLAPVLSRSSGFVPDGLVRRVKGQGAARLPPATITARVTFEEGDLPRYAQQVLEATSVEMCATVRSVRGTERLDWLSGDDKFAKILEEMQYDRRGAVFFVAGYGATRRVESSVRVDESARNKARLTRYERVASLFEEHLGLLPISYWLPELSRYERSDYNQVVSLMNALLPDSCRMQGKLVTRAGVRENLFEIGGISLPFRHLSDGYRAYIGWIGDMLFHLVRSFRGSKSRQPLSERRGVVLVDEVDLHLHPEWQRTVMPTLAKALPNMQFIVSTHSPLVVGSLEASNLFVLDEDDAGTNVHMLSERVHGRTSEQILLSPYFGLSSTRSADVSGKLEALAQAATRGDASASMQYLQLLSDGLPKGRISKPASKKIAVKKIALKKAN
jgi:predicted ATPase